VGRVAQVPLGEVATIRQLAGRVVVRTEDAIPSAWVYVDVAGREVTLLTLLVIAAIYSLWRERELGRAHSPWPLPACHHQAGDRVSGER
jgi:hypothetical protein